MTREEAAHIVDVAFGVPQAVRRIGEDKTYHEDEIREAKNMAIKALEQEPCEDCISRQATVERLCKVAEFMNEKRNGLGSPYVMAALFIQDNKDEFPSVTPKPKTSTWNHGTPDVIDEYIITVRERWGKDEEWEYETLGAWYTQDGWELSYDLDEGQEWEIIAWVPFPEPYKAESEDKE